MWNDRDTPLALFISFRAYGTWLHGDKRGSTDRFRNRYRSPHIPQDKTWQRYNQQRLKAPPFRLRARHRKVVAAVIRETCDIRGWLLYALSVRTNHVHSVIASNKKPSAVLNALKANATRKLREEGLWPHSFSPWSRKGSEKKLWTERSVQRAIDYVLYKQGGDLPDFNE